ncbi:coronin-7-like isoform X1 [Mytilus edulis]|uniref:coronin-7-like isoform X1 n=2 Tax=Mytilus edulis TaxID=6550 RepID=UPI0039F07BA2
MAWRFKASKYKNSAPKLLKREEWIGDISAGNLPNSCGNHIKASCQYMAFNVDTSGGGNLAILPINTSGRLTTALPMLKAHGDFVTDFEFSPFDDFLLATGSADNTIKVWQLPEDTANLTETISDVSPAVVLPGQQRRIENVTWNPVADNILTVTSHNTVKLFDVSQGTEKCCIDSHKDQIQSVSWKGDGTCIVTSCKDKLLRVIDPRSSTVQQEGSGHQNIKDSRAVWLGNKDNIVTTGFDSSRNREISIWDSRNLSSSLNTVSVDASSGTLIPLYDADTGMIFFAGKGDNTIKYCEITDKTPYLQENSVASTEQIKGAGLVPKLALNVMAGEVNRILILTKSNVLPTPYIVPRKSYKEFHDDLFPDTPCGEPALSTDDWFSGQNAQVQCTSLDPAKRKKRQTGSRTIGSKGDNQTNSISKTKEITKPKETSKSVIQETQDIPQTSKPEISGKDTSNVIPKQATPTKVTTDTPTKESAGTPTKRSSDTPKEQSPALTSANKPVTKVFTAVRQSKFKYLKGHTLHKSLHIDNIRKLYHGVPGESDMFYANQTRCVVPVEGAGGLLSVLEFNKPGRLADTGTPVLQHKSKATDYVWDPFNDSRLAVSCDDAKVWIWNIPEGGLAETVTEPSMYLRGHTEKLYFVRFHPLASDILVSSAYDFTVRIWDLTEGKEKLQLTTHPDQVFCVAWSPDGRYLATVCKDGRVRIFDPRKSPDAIKEGEGPDGPRGARVVWALNGKYLVITGFDKLCSRQLYVYDVDKLESPLYIHQLDFNPAVLVPYYDDDSKTLFVTGRGDGVVHSFEISTEHPHIFPLSPVQFDGLHQALSFLPKTCCDVKKVEFAKGWRLTNNTVEPVSFTLPRVKTEYFQDDVFPDTKVIDKPVMTSTEWLSGANTPPRTVSLRPKDMKPLSEAPVEAPKERKYESFNPDTYKSDEQKKEELLDAVTKKLEIKESPLPQDLAEGVDDDEWGDD